MTPLVLSDIEAAVRASWCAETCTPESRSAWTPANPARDQCGVTALVVNDLLGGDLVVGEVHVGGVWADFHWWNRLSGVDVDLTREQFAPGEVVTGGVVRARPPNEEIRRCKDEYLLLRRLVWERLGLVSGAR